MTTPTDAKKLAEDALKHTDGKLYNCTDKEIIDSLARAVLALEERIRKLKKAGHRVNDALQAHLPFNSINNTWAKALAADAKEGEGK